MTRDCAGPRRTPVSSGRRENPARSEKHENLSPADGAPRRAPQIIPDVQYRPSCTDDVIHCWVSRVVICDDKPERGILELGCVLVLRQDTCAGNIVIRIAMDIDKLEIAFHLRSHSLGIARELLPDILFERGSSPASHFLNLGV